MKMDYIKDAKVKIAQSLNDRQRAFMQSFEEKNLSREDSELVLTTMIDDQLDNLLLELQITHKDDILKYLLTKAGQWTELSETMAAKTSEERKT